MSTMDTRYNVVHSFLGKRYGRAGNFYSSGDALYTYNVKLAYRDANGEVYFTPAMNQKYSVTTSAHQRAVREVLGANTEVRED
jgi:hypothetical protein